ncbi:hypothetical protein T11_7130 [Trichinella zimbabwensis]|uniref:Uncharacterized protein n=1 Tax=Trichinella zimbabwensis TaxID=268475 RepID=A0A0V1H1F4_9BILA|nr:hypothetical protein T11_7130 [Trichinella zimbabwensis]
MQIGTIAGTASYFALKRSALQRRIAISNETQTVKRGVAAVLHSFLCFEVLSTISQQLKFPLTDTVWDHFLEVLKSPYQPVVEVQIIYNFRIFSFK